MIRISFVSLTAAFNAWAAEAFEVSSGEQLASDGKSIKARVQRSVSVLTPTAGIDPVWVGVQRIIKVERTGIRQQKPFEEKVFYISSLTENASEFSQRIRAHWHVENRLHWVKDVVLKEDESPLCGGYALINCGILQLGGGPDS